jgi:hypothetical protein
MQTIIILIYALGAKYHSFLTLTLCVFLFRKHPAAAIAIIANANKLVQLLNASASENILLFKPLFSPGIDESPYVLK